MCLSACPHVATRERLSWFSSTTIARYFVKICWHIPVLIQTWHYRTLNKKPNTSFCAHRASFARNTHFFRLQLPRVKHTLYIYIYIYIYISKYTFPVSLWGNGTVRRTCSVFWLVHCSRKQSLFGWSRMAATFGGKSKKSGIKYFDACSLINRQVYYCGYFILWVGRHRKWFGPTLGIGLTVGRPPVQGVPLSVLILNRNRAEQTVGCLTAKGNAVHMRLWCAVEWSPPAKVFDAGMVSCDARQPSRVLWHWRSCCWSM